VSIFVLGMIPTAAVVSAVFSYLRYRSYVGLVRHISDKHGVDGLNALNRVVGPYAASAGKFEAMGPLPHRADRTSRSIVQGSHRRIDDLAYRPRANRP
jgi:hypothetical protein